MRSMFGLTEWFVECGLKSTFTYRIVTEWWTGGLRGIKLTFAL